MINLSSAVEPVNIVGPGTSLSSLTVVGTSVLLVGPVGVGSTGTPSSVLDSKHLESPAGSDISTLPHGVPPPGVGVPQGGVSSLHWGNGTLTLVPPASEPLDSAAPS